MEVSRWGAIGFDETSVDRYPAIYTAVATPYVDDMRIRTRIRDRLGKKNPQNNSIPDFIDDIDYTWLEFDQRDNRRIRPHYKWGVIVGSLIENINLSSPVSIYIDGEMNRASKNHTIDIIRDISGIEKDLIHLYSGKDFDKKVGVVNKAHKVAYWQKNRLTTIGNVIKDKHRRKLNEELIASLTSNGRKSK